MTKGKTILISVLLIVSTVIIKVLVADSNTKLDKELIDFFSGILFGVGIALLYPLIFKKRKMTE